MSKGTIWFVVVTIWFKKKNAASQQLSGLFYCAYSHSPKDFRVNHVRYLNVTTLNISNITYKRTMVMSNKLLNVDCMEFLPWDA